MVFEPTGDRLESLISNSNSLQLSITIEIDRSRPLTTDIWELLFREMEQAALNTDMEIYEQARNHMNPIFLHRDGFEYIRRHTNRFVITSIDRGSILVGGAVFLAAAGAWFFKEFIKPGWDKSQSKEEWDTGVASLIDKAVPALRTQIDTRVTGKLRRLKIRKITLRQPPNKNESAATYLLSGMPTEVTTTFHYDKHRPLEKQPKKD